MNGVPELHGKGIGDEQVAESAPLVRALIVERLEKMWAACEPWITGAGGKPDPRYMEAGIRIADRLIRLYRLDLPGPPADAGDGDLVPVLDLGTRGLNEIEARMRDGSL